MKITVVYYLEVTSSWCHWAEPAWVELQKRYAGQPIEFSWKIALLDKTGLPASRAQLDWFYRRSGLIVRSPYLLDSGWFDPDVNEFLAPNCVAEAAKDFGVTGDQVRLAIAEAAVRAGQKVGQWEISAAIAARKAPGLDAVSLLARARSPEIEKRVRATTAEFHALQITQRPAFVLDSNIGDRAVFSGVAKVGPIAAAIDAMLDDAAAYAAHVAHIGPVPAA